MTPTKITAALGIILVVLGIVAIASSRSTAGMVPLVIGSALIYLAFRRGRVATLIFGHACIVAGAYLITWGILLLPYSQPGLSGILERPLFWGFFSLMGGICAIFHGFCRCVNKQFEQFEGITGNKATLSQSK